MPNLNYLNSDGHIYGRAHRCGWIAGTAVLVLHSLLVLALFLRIQFNQGVQAEFAWFFFMLADFPTSLLVWDYVANTTLFSALFEWGYTFGSGPNLRAFVIHLLFGGAQWFLLGWITGFLLWPKKGWVAVHYAKCPNVHARKK